MTNANQKTTDLSLDSITLETLENHEFLTASQRSYIEKKMEDNPHVIILGPIGSGKSSLLWALAKQFCPYIRSLSLDKVDSEDENLALMGRMVQALPPSTFPCHIVSEIQDKCYSVILDEFNFTLNHLAKTSNENHITLLSQLSKTQNIITSHCCGYSKTTDNLPLIHFGKDDKSYPFASLELLEHIFGGIDSTLVPKGEYLFFLTENIYNAGQGLHRQLVAVEPCFVHDDKCYRGNAYR